MTFFVDATALAGAAIDGPRRTACLELLDAVARGGVEGRTSPLVLAELWRIEREGASGALDGLTELTHRVFAPLLPIEDEAFARALALHAPGLEPADRLHAATCTVHGIATIVSANPAYDAVATLRRIDPAHAGALRQLLGVSSR